MADRTTVLGRLGREPRRKTTPKGDVVEFSLASTARLLGGDGRWADGATTWYEVSAWDRLGSNAATSLHKGQPVIVHGRVFEHEWTGRDGEVHREMRITAAAIGHDLNGGTAAFARAAGSGAERPGVSVAAAVQPPVDEQAVRAADDAAAEEAAGDWGALPGVEAREPAPAGGGWSTVRTAEDDPPF